MCRFAKKEILFSPIIKDWSHTRKGFALLLFMLQKYLLQNVLNKIPGVFPENYTIYPEFMETAISVPTIQNVTTHGLHHHHHSECYYPWVTSSSLYQQFRMLLPMGYIPSLYQQFRMLLPMGYIIIIVPTIQNVATHGIHHCTNNSECYYPCYIIIIVPTIQNVTTHGLLPSLYQQFRMLLPMGYIIIIVPTIQNVATHV